MEADELLVKTPFEERVFDFDFSRALDDGETIAPSPVPTVTVSPAGITVSAIVSLGGIVQARFAGGVVATTYHATCRVSTSTQKRELCGALEVIEC